MVAAVLRRLCIRRPLVVVQPHAHAGVPLSPLLFLGGVSIAFASAWTASYTLHPIVWAGYPAIGVCWWIALWSVQPTIVTEYGIVPDVQQMETAVPWGRVADYTVVHRDDGGARFIFFYRDAEAASARIDVAVSAAQYEALARVVAQKLDARFLMAVQRAYRTHPSAQ